MPILRSCDKTKSFLIELHIPEPSVRHGVSEFLQGLVLVYILEQARIGIHGT